MAGKAKHAEQLANHLNAPIDAACLINKTGSTATMAIAGVAGAAAKAAMDRRGRGEELRFDKNGWLALGVDWFALVYGDSFLGRPKGEPIATIRYADVAGVELKQGKLTMRADVALLEGRSVAFETKRMGANKGNPDVFALLATRCSAAASKAA
jgi:hypothetical protein